MKKYQVRVPEKEPKALPPRMAGTIRFQGRTFAAGGRWVDVDASEVAAFRAHRLHRTYAPTFEVREVSIETREQPPVAKPAVELVGGRTLRPKTPPPPRKPLEEPEEAGVEVSSDEGETAPEVQLEEPEVSGEMIEEEEGLDGGEPV